MIRIAIVSDQTMLRQGYCSLVEKRNDMTLLFDATNGIELLDILKERSNHPDVILMDVSMQKMSGIIATEILHKKYPDIRIILMSDIEHSFLIYEVFRLGAMGFVSKNITYQLILTAVQTVYGNQYFISGSTFVDSVKGYSILDNLEDLKHKVVMLTGKQKQFMRLCATSLAYKEIAIIMNISPKTADRYRENLFSILNIKCRVGLALFSIYSGIVCLPEPLSPVARIKR